MRIGTDESQTAVMLGNCHMNSIHGFEPFGMRNGQCVLQDTRVAFQITNLLEGFAVYCQQVVLPTSTRTAQHFKTHSIRNT